MRYVSPAWPLLGVTTWKYSGWTPWASLQQVGIEAELEDGAALGLLGELGVDGFVGPGPLPRLVGAEEDVGAAVPAAVIVEEGGLDDDVLAGAHGFEGGGGGGFGVFEGAEVQDVAALGLEVVDVGLLVGEAAVAEDVAQGVVRKGRLRPSRATLMSRPVRWRQARELERSVAERLRPVGVWRTRGG